MTLSSSEKLQAIPGPWPNWISDLRTKFVSKDGTLGDKLDWDKTRGRPFANIAVFVMMAHGSGQSSSQLSSFLERTDAVGTACALVMEPELTLISARRAFQEQGRESAVISDTNRYRLSPGGF